ncbi:hypothetical protein BDY21DRAFT_191542 [Lineolata rhizophorae]|uniref:Uncharacterized protein n=1 Tax=Lineolata rhizophorae TaxID=578093 RepID=A0A6A6P668_9PEZI|nr:hypothetical protein BDY21DRAFT_191542 [Lineolata rhizophorae]
MRAGAAIDRHRKQVPRQWAVGLAAASVLASVVAAQRERLWRRTAPRQACSYGRQAGRRSGGERRLAGTIDALLPHFRGVVVTGRGTAGTPPNIKSLLPS